MKLEEACIRNNLRQAKSSGHKKSLILDEAFDVSAWH